MAAMVALLIAWGAAPAKATAPEVALACASPAAAPIQPVAEVAPKAEPIVSTAVVAKKPAPKTNRLAEKPRAAPTLARTVASAVKPGQFSSTPIPSGAARLVNVSRVSGALRVAIDTVAGARVTGVTTLQHPARLIIDVTGLPPISTHVVSLNDSELRKISVVKQGKGTRLVIDLVRLPTRVVQQGDSALISF